MDELVLKWITPIFVLLTIVTCITLFYLPTLVSEPVMAYEEYEAGEMLPEIAEGQLPEAIVEATNETSAQLKIELPQGISFSDIRLENDYLTRVVSVYIPTDATDYFSQYRVKGSCDHIAAITYNRIAGMGVMGFVLDQVYEIKTYYEDGNLFLDFIDPHEIYDKVIVVDAGHGGRDGGASRQGIAEKNINLSILLELKKLLDESQENIGVYYTRTEDVALTLDQRVQLANKSNADLFISIHNNASGGIYGGSSGTQVLYSESDTSEYSSERFAKICMEHLTDTAGSRNKGLVKGDKIYIIRTSEVPVALIEVGFMSNRDELAKLKDEEYQAVVAEGIYKAILAAFEEGY